MRKILTLQLHLGEDREDVSVRRYMTGSDTVVYKGKGYHALQFLIVNTIKGIDLCVFHFMLIAVIV